MTNLFYYFFSLVSLKRGQIATFLQCLVCLFAILNSSSAQAQCTNESVTNGTFNTNISGWTRSGTGWEYRGEYGGIIRNWLDNGTDVLTQNISNVNVTSGYMRLTFDVKMSRVNNTNSSLIVRFLGTDYLTINMAGSTSAVTLIAQSGSSVSTDQGGLTNGTFGKVTLLIPQANGVNSGDLQFVHSAVGSQNDVEMDNITVTSPCSTPLACDLSAVTNGKSNNSLAGWNISGTGAGNWAYQAADGGRIQNMGDNTNQTISQQVNNIAVNDGQMELDFDVIMQHVTNCELGTKLEVRFGGVQYLTVTMFESNNITITTASGAVVVSTPATILNNSTANIKLNIPWAGAIPASGLLEFTHNTLGCNGSNSSDVILDNILMKADCICPLNTAGSIIDYCELSAPVTNCGEQYFYYLPAAAANARNNPTAIELTTEMPSANVVIRNASGTVATTGTVLSTGIYTYSTSPANMFTSTYEAPFYDRGFIIESDQPITAKWTLNNTQNQSLVVLRGRNALGTAFRVASVLNTGDQDGPHYFTVMATEDNTLVQIGAPVSESVTLNRGEQYTYSGDNVPVSGILVLSDKQIVVNSGQQHKSILSGASSMEGTNIQVLPIRGLGQEYIIVNTEGRNGYQVVAAHNNTEVRLDGQLVTILNAGEAYQSYAVTATTPTDLRYGKPYRITTSNPAYVYNIGTNSIGEFEMFQAPALDLPFGKASKVAYSNQHGQSGWVVVDQTDVGKLKRNGSASLGTVNTWILPASGSTPAKQVTYWNGGFAPNAINQITCDNCNSLYVGQLRDNGSQGAQIGYISSFDAEPIQFFNTNQLPDELLTFGYTIGTVSYRTTPPANLSHVLTEASSAGGLHITGISLSRESGNASVGSVASSTGLNFTLNLPPAGSVAEPGDELNVFITTEDAAGNTAALCMKVLLENDPALPVKLVEFHVSREGQMAMLNWSTTEELNSERFEIERSADGKAWTQIGLKSSTGESTQLVEYNFADIKPLVGINYYRLKMVDRDNTFAYSTIRSVQFNEQIPVVYVYPNPSKGIIRLGNINLGQIRNVEIFNISGLVVFETKTVSPDGIHVKDLPNGIYILKLSHSDGAVYTHKLLISK
jgi:hypothetical protein